MSKVIDDLAVAISLAMPGQEIDARAIAEAIRAEIDERIKAAFIQFNKEFFGPPEVKP